MHQVKKQSLDITDVVFILPQDHAAGRMKHGAFAVELLIEKNFEKALEYASSINAYNTERKEIEISLDHQRGHGANKRK